MLKFEGNPNSLYAIFHEYGDKAMQAKRTQPVVFGSFDLSSSNPQAIEVASSLRTSNAGIANKDFKVSRSNENHRHALPGTGRMAFGPTQELREIYQVHSISHNQKNKNHQQPPQERFEFEDISFEKLSLNNNVEAPSSSTTSNIRNAEHIQQPTDNSLPNKKTKMIDPNFPPPAPNSNKSTMNAPPKAPSTTNTTNNPNNKGLNNTTSKVTPTSSTPGSAPKGRMNTGNPYIKASGGGGIPSTAATSGLPTGLAAARARMAALGESWAEEEDLPGMKYVSSASSSLQKNGTVNSSVMKETSKATQRQQKLIVAKKK